MLYKLIRYDVWGNKKDGYEVNNQYTTSQTVDIPDNVYDPKRIVKLLKEADILAPQLRANSVELEWPDETICYINDIRGGDCIPWGELRADT
jgi:hypothetical protein